MASEVTPATDHYALGVIAYELVTGAPPFVATSVLELLELHTSAMPARPRLADGPDEYFDLVLELLRKDMKQRPQSAGEVKKSLERVERLLATRGTRVSGLKQQAVRPTRIQPPPPIGTEPSLRPTAAASSSAAPALPAAAPARWPWIVLAAVVLPAVLGLGVLIGREPAPPIIQPPPATPIAPPAVTPMAPPAPVASAPPAPTPEADEVPHAPSNGAAIVPAAPTPRPARASRRPGVSRELVRIRLKSLQKRAANVHDSQGRLLRLNLDELSVMLLTQPPEACLAALEKLEAENFPTKER